jgi:hypothetical protein
MAKKCLPGVICLENMTLAMFFFLFVVLAYLYYIFLVKVTHSNNIQQSYIIQQPPVIQNPMIQSLGSPNVMMDPYSPPVRIDNLFMTPSVGRGIPVNIETRGISSGYTQMGILTREDNREMILSLMGRRLMSGVDKWQYYTISNTGSINTKLPISVRGRNCSGEYGCDCLMDGDVVFVEGYKDTFRVTLYEPAKFQYIPFI